ncbi:hypothetical protein P7K49_007989, partial [Saguinus oedipus]
GPLKPGSPYLPPVPWGPDPAYIYYEFLQQRWRLVSKLDLEESRHLEAQEKEHCYDLTSRTLRTKQKEELVAQKQRKRPQMLRESSPPPPTIQSKRQTPSTRLALSTCHSPNEMNNSPNFEEKKFLTIFNLTHISTEKRKDKERLVEKAEGD